MIDLLLAVTLLWCSGPTTVDSLMMCAHGHNDGWVLIDNGYERCHVSIDGWYRLCDPKMRPVYWGGWR